VVAVIVIICVVVVAGIVLAIVFLILPRLTKRGLQRKGSTTIHLTLQK